MMNPTVVLCAKQLGLLEPGLCHLVIVPISQLYVKELSAEALWDVVASLSFARVPRLMCNSQEHRLDFCSLSSETILALEAHPFPHPQLRVLTVGSFPFWGIG